MSILRLSDIIESRHATSILVCLFMRGDMNKSLLYDLVSSNPRMPKKLERLEEQGMVELRSDGRRTVVSLTDRGMAVAAGLCGLERMLYGSVDDPALRSEGCMDVEAPQGAVAERDVYSPRVDSYEGGWSGRRRL